MHTSEPDQTTTPSNACLKPSDEHHSYLLRLWRSSGDGQWRASLQSVQTGERHMFADLESLLSFLVEASKPCNPVQE